MVCSLLPLLSSRGGGRGMPMLGSGGGGVGTEWQRADPILWFATV